MQYQAEANLLFYHNLIYGWPTALVFLTTGSIVLGPSVPLYVYHVTDSDVPCGRYTAGYTKHWQSQQHTSRELVVCVTIHGITRSPICILYVENW